MTCDPTAFAMRPFSAVFFVYSRFFVTFAVTGRSSWLLCSTVWLCCLSLFLERAIRLVDPRVTLLCSFDVFS